MPEDKLLIALIALKSVKKSQNNFDDTKPKINFSETRKEEIRKKISKSRHKFSK